MEILLQHLTLLIPALLAVIVCALLANRTKLSLLFTLIEGALSLFVFCFLMRQGASLEELLLTLLILLTPSLLFNKGKARDEE